MTNEDKFTDMRESMDEIYSSMVILQQAVKNEFDSANLNDINNHLELLINKFAQLKQTAFELQNNLFVSI